MKEKFSVERFNFISILTEGTFYYTGNTFFDVYVIMPVFIEAMTGDIKLASLAVAFKLFFFAIPQLFMGFYTSKIRSVPRFLGNSGLIGRAASFLIPLFLILDVSLFIKIFVVMFSISVFSFADGITHVPWLDLLGRTITPSRRGRLLGLQIVFGGICSFLAGLLIKNILSSGRTFDSKYTQLFLIGAVILTISGFLLYFLKDLPRKHSDEAHVKTYLKKLRGHVTLNSEYRKLMLVQILGSFSGLAAPLYILFAKNTFSLADTQVTSLIFLQIVGSLAGGFTWGIISNRKGNRMLIRYGLAANIFVTAAALSAPFCSSTLLIPVLSTMVFTAGLTLGNWIGYANHLIDIVDEKDRPTYLSLTSLIVFPFTLLPFVGGVIADLLGFQIVFIIVLAFASAAFSLSFRMKGIKTSDE